MLTFKIISFSTVLILVSLMIVDATIGISLWWYISLFILWFVFMSIGTFSMSWQLYLSAITSNPIIKQKKIAITFDDGPNTLYTPKVLKLLKEYNAKATFFCIGQNAEAHPEILKSIFDNGHDIGNHSYTHKMMIDFNSTENWLNELKRTDDCIFKVIGKKPTVFRPPFGVTTPNLAKALKVTEHIIVGWNIRSYDTINKNPKSIFKRITKSIQPGSIILLHDTNERIEIVLEQLLQFLQSHAYEIVTINDLLDET